MTNSINLIQAGSTVPHLSAKSATKGDSIVPYYAHLKKTPKIELLKKKAQKTYIRLIVPTGGQFDKVKVANIQIDDIRWSFTCPDQMQDCLISKMHSAAKKAGLLLKYNEKDGNKFQGIWPKERLFTTALQYDPKLGDIHQVAILESMTQAYDDDANKFIMTDRGLGSAIMLKLREVEDLPGEDVEVGEFKYQDSLDLKTGKLMVITKSGKGRDTSYSLEVQAKRRDLSKAEACINYDIKPSDVVADYTKSPELAAKVEEVLREYFGEKYDELRATFE